MTGTTCYERDEALCEDPLCLRAGGCRIQIERIAANVPERLNPLLKMDALVAADEAACRLDGMFRDLFNTEDRMDLIITIIRAATTCALSPSHSETP
jgi:hypothetical protein